MKHFLLALFLTTGTCTVGLQQHAVAQTSTTPVTAAAFTTKIDLLDSYIAAGNLTSAQATWTEVHGMMLSVLGKSKTSIRTATTTADRDAHIAISDNQQTIYWAVWNLKNNLTTNRAALHTKLGEFGATIY